MNVIKKKEIRTEDANIISQSMFRCIQNSYNKLNLN
jgi:hypothetical protein